MTFTWQTLYYPTRLEYQQALLPFAVPAFLKRVTIHHTWKPTVDQWRGRRSMDALERFYRLKGWPSGPHLFIAPDGLWAGTPLSTPGTHAGSCNRDSIGIEIVGDYDRQTWDVGLRERVYQILVLLLHWLGATETAIRGHRECLANKSCPGTAIAMDLVRAHVGERLFDRRFIVTTPAANVRLYPRTNSVVVGRAARGANLNAHLVRGALFQGSDRWARVQLHDGTRGHIWAGLGYWEMV